MFQKDPNKPETPSIDDAISALGGGPPVGWGMHEDEAHYWAEPVYRVHPLTNRLEAVDGLFRRFWVEHVELLMQMRADGWGHEDILDVAEELHQRQVAAYEEQEKLVATAKEQRSGLHTDNIAEAFGRYVNDEPVPEMGKSLHKSLLRLEGVEKGIGKRLKAKYHTLPKLPFAYGDMSPLWSEEAMRLHYNVLHKSYVNKLNALVEGKPWQDWSAMSLLKRIDELPEHMRPAIKQFAGGHFNHSILWTSLRKPKKNNQPSQLFSRLFDSRFQSFENFKEHCKVLADYWKGTGWLWLVYCPSSKGLKLYPMPKQGNPFSNNEFPLLGIDLWEHAYLADHGASLDRYLKHFWNAVDWDVIEKRYDVAFKVEMLKVELFKADPSVGGQRTLTPQEAKVQREQSFSRRPQGVTNAAVTPDEEVQNEAPSPVIVIKPQEATQ